MAKRAQALGPRVCRSCRKKKPADAYERSISKSCLECHVQGRPRARNYGTSEHVPTARRCIACKAVKGPEEYAKYAKTCDPCRALKAVPGPMPCARCRRVRPRAEYQPGKRLCAECQQVPPPSHRIDEKPCIECHRTLPVAAYGPPRERNGRRHKWRKRWSVVCLECWAKRDAERAERRAARRARRTTWKRRDGTWRRRCSNCRVEKDLHDDYYVGNANAPTLAQRYQYTCKACQRTRTSEHSARLWREDPEGMRRKNNAWQSAWRERNPEKYRAQLRRRAAKIDNDPVKRARRLENRRIEHRLRAERQGRQVKSSHRNAARGEDPRLWLPVGPFVAFFEKVLARDMYSVPGFTGEGILDGVSLARVCEGYGMSSRRWLEHRTGKTRHIDYAVADRVLTREGLNWWDVWDADDLTAEQVRRLDGEPALDTAA